MSQLWSLVMVVMLYSIDSVIQAQAQEPVKPAVLSSIPDETPEQYAKRMQWFREAKFGWFICWGPCSLAEGEIGWSRNGPRPGIPGGQPGSGIPLEVYDNLYKQFNPTLYNPQEWASLIKESGAKYVIFLTKHHDGFSLFNSKLSDYTITQTPYRRDVTRELADALHTAGIRIVWYYSQPDWHHPDYLTENHDRYIEYLHGQVRELLTNYGKIDGIWFDGLYGGVEEWDTPGLFAMIHELQPGILINNRAGVRGDFDTPEQTLGSFQLNRPWESCITMSPSWSWTGAQQPVKSLKECLQLLIRCTGGGGNLALDTGPMPDGQIEPRQVENYRAMGQWLEKYGDTIYATTGGPYGPGEWGCATRKGSTIYLHVMNWASDTIRLPALLYEVRAVKVLTGGEVTVTQDTESLSVSVPPEQRDEIDTLIALELDATPDEVAAIAPMSALTTGSLTAEGKLSASGTWSSEYDVAMLADGDEETRWGCEPNSQNGWVQVDLQEAVTVGRATFVEANWNRVASFTIEYKETDEDEWKVCYQGTTMKNQTVSFEPVDGRSFRLNILQASDVPTIWEFHLYSPDNAGYTR